MNELSTGQFCIMIRNGPKIWIPKEKMDMWDEVRETAKKTGGEIKFEGERINPVDVVGVFRDTTMATMTKEKNGEWQCESGLWHPRGDKCLCRNQIPSFTKREDIVSRMEATKARLQKKEVDKIS